MRDDQATLPIADRLDGLRQPFEHAHFLGQSSAETTFLNTTETGRLHHAWLLKGEAGTGKATFAFRVARQFVEHANVSTLPERASYYSANREDAAVFKRVATGAHPNVLHLRIPYEEKTKRFKTELTVDEVRKSVGFFGSSAGTDGWRVAIVDSADQMNRNAANALLKILEEPPARTLFFVLSSNPGRLLPTIRSRCQSLDFAPLSGHDLTQALNTVSNVSVSAADLVPFEEVLSGSVRRAFQFLDAGGADLFASFNALLGQRDHKQLMAFSEAVSARGEGDRYALFKDMTLSHIAGRMRAMSDEGSEKITLVRFSEVWEKVSQRFDLEQRFNLDRKETVLAVFHDLKSL